MVFDEQVFFCEIRKLYIFHLSKNTDRILTEEALRISFLGWATKRTKSINGPTFCRKDVQFIKSGMLN